MKRFILTGTPGSGKTAILRQLELEGFGVVREFVGHGVGRRMMEEPKVPNFFSSEMLRSDFKLRRGSDGSLSWAMNIVGTPYRDVHCSCSIASSVAVGSNDSAGTTIVAP